MRTLIELQRRNSLLMFYAWLQLAFFIMAWINYHWDTRILLGINLWIKPMKFGLSGFIYLATLAWVSHYLRGVLSDQKQKRYGHILGLMILGETLLISMQSARGKISHFNQSSALDGAIFSVMGVMIIINTIYFFLFMRPFFQDKIKLNPIYQRSICWATILFLAGSVVGGVMSGLNRHSIGAADGSLGLPFFNFSTVAGDLRVAHFLGLHALQVIPLVGWLLQKKSIIWFYIFSVSYSLILGLTFLQAMLGYPLVPAF